MDWWWAEAPILTVNAPTRSPPSEFISTHGNSRAQCSKLHRRFSPVTQVFTAWCGLCVSEMQGVRCAQRGRPTTGSPLPLFLRLRLTADREALVRWVYSVSFIIYCSLSFAFSFLSFCLLSPSLLRQSVPSSLISAQFGGALLESCNLQCRAFVNKLWAGHSPGSCENITLLQFKYMFFKEYLSWALIWFTKFDSWASAVYIPALGLCVSLL